MSVRLSAACLVAAAVSAFPQVAAAQRLDAPRLDQGFAVTAVPDATGAERTRQPGLYMLEVDFKPIRLQQVAITDGSGQSESAVVYYLVYRLKNKPLQSGQRDDNLRPVNQLDTPYTGDQFLPTATLLTFQGAEESDEPDQTLLDLVLPEAVAAISRRERRAQTPEILDSVEIIQPLPEAADDFEPIYGMVTWTGVDEQTDYVTVVLRGFTNAYEVRQAGDGEQVFRKALVLKLRRRGDEFEPSETEFEFDGRPEWRYLPAES